jgi:hypothetical protein
MSEVPLLDLVGLILVPLDPSVVPAPDYCNYIKIEKLGKQANQ